LKNRKNTSIELYTTYCNIYNTTKFGMMFLQKISNGKIHFLL